MTTLKGREIDRFQRHTATRHKLVFKWSTSCYPETLQVCSKTLDRTELSDAFECQLGGED